MTQTSNYRQLNFQLPSPVIQFRNTEMHYNIITNLKVFCDLMRIIMSNINVHRCFPPNSNCMVLAYA